MAEDCGVGIDIAKATLDVACVDRSRPAVADNQRRGRLGRGGRVRSAAAAARHRAGSHRRL